MGDPVKHARSSITKEYYSPPNIMERAYVTFGDFDLDPASCVVANKFVGARAIYTTEDDGLAHEWHGTIYLNPPGGTVRMKLPGKSKTRSVAEAAVWWNKLMQEYAAGRVRAACVCVFNWNLFQTVQAFDCRHPLTFPGVFPSFRVKYVNEEGQQTTVCPHPSAWVCVSDDPAIRASFRENFSDLGFVSSPTSF